MRKPGGAEGCLLRSLRGAATGNPNLSSPRDGPAIDPQSPHRGGSLLRPRHRLDRVDYRAGIRAVSTRPESPVPCLPRTVSLRRLADGGLGVAAHGFPDDTSPAPPLAD